MKTIPAVILFLSIACTASAQQVKDTGTEDELPLKTVVIREAASGALEEFLAGATLLRFSVYKAGSTRQVGNIMTVFSKDPGVAEITEGSVSGDYKEFVLRLKAPQGREWFRKRFSEAGLTHITFNSGKAVPLSSL